jgi:transcriptional regulator with XRE-family HTH domain
MSEVGARLARARRRRHLTQIQLAERLGRSESYVSTLEQGQKALNDLGDARRIADVDVDVLWLLALGGPRRGRRPPAEQNETRVSTTPTSGGLRRPPRRGRPAGRGHPAAHRPAPGQPARHPGPRARRGLGLADRGAAWIEPACAILWLIASGHTPAGAEAWAGQLPSYAAATRRVIDVFATVAVRLWAEIAEHDPAEWKSAWPRPPGSGSGTGAPADGLDGRAAVASTAAEEALRTGPPDRA